MKAIKLTVFSIFSLVLSGVFSSVAHATPNGLMYPVIGNTNYSDTFLAYRAGQVDNKHHAIDIFAPKHSHIVSPVDGIIRYVGYPQDSWGWYMVIVDSDGYEYHFMHINNDNPGTDDGLGDAMHAYASDMQGEYNDWAPNRNVPVKKGQHIAYVGDSGNAENTPAHLHFEIIKPQYTQLPYRDIPLEGFENPFPYLNAAQHITSPLPYPELPFEILPYGPYNPGVNVAIGNFDSDPDLEIVTGAGEKGGPHVKIYKKDKTFTGKEFFAYNPQHWTGTDVAAGDLDGDGIDEIITGAGPGGGPHVRAFKPDGTEAASFFAYDARFSGGVYVTAADVDGDGKAEIITGARVGGGPHVRVFKANGQAIADVFPYAMSFSGGVDVAAGDVDGDGKAEIVTAAGPGGGPHVRIFSFTPAEGGRGTLSGNQGFFAYSPSYAGGVRVAVGNVDSKTPASEIVTVPATGGGPNSKMFNTSGAQLKSTMFMEPWWYGYNDVAAGKDMSLVGTGVNRRASVRATFPGVYQWS